MSSTITTSVVTGGTNNHATTVADINNPVTDFVTPGVNGTIALNNGSGGSGSFAVNAQGTPAMLVDIKAGSAYITATPAGQVSQHLRANMTADYTSYTIAANASGSTKYDWIYLKVDPTAANNPASDASDVTSLYTSRSSIATADNGAPPTYGLLLAIVTVVNGASSIANSAITDSRVNASLSSITSNTFFFDFVESGCVWTADSAGSTLNASMTSGFIWISGKRLSVSSVSARAFTASRDTYIDLTDNLDGTATFTYTTVTNNAASPALSTGAIRIGIVVAGSSNIATAASINQGQETAVLPIASSIPYAVTDSLGNLICPRDPQRKTLGYRQLISNFNTSSTSVTQVTGVSVPFRPVANRKVKISIGNVYTSSNSGASQATTQIWEGTVGSGAQLASENATSTGTGTPQTSSPSALKTYTSSSLITVNMGAFVNASTGIWEAASNRPQYLIVELA